MHHRWVYLFEACQLSPQFLIYFGKHTSGYGLFWSWGKAFIDSILLAYGKLPLASSWPCMITSSSDLVGATPRCCSMAAGLRFCVNDRQVFVWLLCHLVFGFMMMRDGCKKDNKLEKNQHPLWSGCRLVQSVWRSSRTHQREVVFVVMRVSLSLPRSCHPTCRNAAQPRGTLVSKNLSAAGNEGGCFNSIWLVLTRCKHVLLLVSLTEVKKRNNNAAWAVIAASQQIFYNKPHMLTFSESIFLVF